MTAHRRNLVLERLPDKEVDALLVSSPENRFYLSGFSGSNGWLFLSPERVALVTDGRYWAQVEVECPGVELVKFRSQEDKRLSKRLAAWLAEVGWRGRLGFEGGDLTYSTWEEARSDLAEVADLKALGGLVEEFRQVKSPEEIQLVRRAAGVADVAFRKALESFREGIRESDFCAELEYRMQKAGARKPSFDTIVASGPNGAFPHAGVTDRVIQVGELVTVDWGALVDGYCSDITRTIWLGDLDERSREIYLAVRRAQKAGVEAVRPSAKGSGVDAVARGLIAEAGYGDYFNHGLGHGVGLAVHEGPALRAESVAVLEPGMVVTVEPGIYVPGVGGSRVEDLVVVTEEGVGYLSGAPYQEPGHKHPLEAWI